MKNRIRMEIWDGNFGPFAIRGEDWNFQIGNAAKDGFRKAALVENIVPNARGADGRRILGRFSTACDALECKRVVALAVKRMNESRRKISEMVGGTRHETRRTVV